VYNKINNIPNFQGFLSYHIIKYFLAVSITIVPFIYDKYLYTLIIFLLKILKKFD
jgi:hypothetical protein